MKLVGRSVLVMFVGQCLLLPVFAQKAAPAVASDGPTVGVEILSDTQGANLNPYMKAMISDLKSRWLSEIRTGRSANQAGESIVSLTIDSDGHLSALHLDQSAQVDLDRAAWTTAKLERYSPLPPALKSSDLKLLITFSAN